ncbi:ABC bile acid transporter [Penicillium angulare]|uniref:ABC bile acid transporter n=1 Tax=Penicillium angulare TaxID=116970 RepID=A0A9W9JZL3_9EURO|nr:ABC bile acid transporter [Penicillium angulare]
MEIITSTVIGLLGIHCIVTKLLSSPKEDTATEPGDLNSEDASITETIRGTTVQVYSTLLTLGPAVGVIAASIIGWNDSTWTPLGLWILLASQAVITLTENVDRRRFHFALSGAVSSSALALLLTFQLNVSSQTEEINRATLLVGLIAATLTLSGFLAIPQRSDKSIENRPIDRQFTCSILEIAAFSWPRNIFNPLTISSMRVSDLPILHLAARAGFLTRNYAQKDRSGQCGLGITLAKTYADVIIWQWALTVLLRSVVVLGPQFLTFRLLQELEALPQTGDSLCTNGVLLALALGLCKIFEVWISLWLRWITTSKLQIPLQATLSSLVYRKALCLPSVFNSSDGVNKERKGVQSSALTLMSLESARACMAYTTSNKFPMLVAKFISTTAFLVKLIGWKNLLPGIIASIIVMPLTTFLTRKYHIVQIQQGRHRDQRVNILKKALLAIRQLKLSAEETAYKRRIMEARSQELRQLFKAALWMCSLVFAANVGPILFAGIPIYLFALKNKQLSVSVSFTCINLFQQLQSDLSILSLTSTYFSEALAGLQRLDSYLSQREIGVGQVTASDRVSCKGASIAWPGDDEGRQRFILKDLSLDFPVGQLSIVTGETGSGKSLLLYALAGEAITVSGTISSPSQANHLEFSTKISDMEKTNAKESQSASQTIATVPQSAWMDNTSIRDNILFGLPMNQQRYRAALNNCALDADLEAMKDGDETIVGLKGVLLSGGQRWRVALARALYSNAEVILMEDVLSAVDAGVRDILVDKAIRGDLARGRTRILVTHHAQQCQTSATYMVQLHEGRVKEQRRLSPNTPSPFPTRGEQKCYSLSEEVDRDNCQYGDGDAPPPGTDTNNKKDAAHRISKSTEKEGKPKAPLQKETALSRYKAYFGATGGMQSWLLVSAAVIVCESLSLANSWWLQYWSSQMNQSREVEYKLTTSDESTRTAIHGAIFMTISCLNCLAIAVRCFVWFIIGAKASASLFEKMTSSILDSPVQWLEGSSHGEILTRSTSDTYTVDQRLPHDIGYTIESMSQVVSIVMTNIFVFPTEILLVPLLLYAYCRVGTRLISSTRTLKNISATATSSLYQQLNSILAPDGFLTVRAYGMSRHFMDRIFRAVDDVSSANWHHALCLIKMDLQLGVIGALFLTSVALSAVLTKSDAGTTAIALTFVMQFSKAMSGFLQRIATVESGLNSMERIIEYGDLPTEPKSGIDPPASWPSNGKVQVQNLVAAYNTADNSRPTLNDISFLINPGERVGIVGRTGAGKSSLNLAFARLINQQEGKIIIDGVDISTLKLHALRQQLFAIPQDPHLFTRSIRSTLDPEGAFDDTTLLGVLRKVHFTTSSSKETDTSADLSFMVKDGGSNLSQGQRQMLFLARALLYRPIIVIMDEATSAIDVETDTAIQAALRAGLPDTTIISVVHRLATIADFDKVLVLEDGCLVESGTPESLYIQKGIFWELVCHSSDREHLVNRFLSPSSTEPTVIL